MHPDAMIAALKAELAEARDDNHRRQIEGEIKRIDALDRPVALPETPDLVHDQGAVAGPGDIVRISLEEAEKLIKRGILAPMAGGDPDSPVGLGPILSESAPNVQTVQSQA